MKNRLQRQKIEEIFKKGKRVSFDNFNLIYLNEKERVGNVVVIVSKKIYKKSTQRNKLKRIAKEMIRKIATKGFNKNFIILFTNKDFKKENLNKDLKNGIEKYILML